MRATVETGKLLGDFAREIVVRTNDPERPVLHLTIRGRVLASFEMFPQLGVRLSNRGAALRRAQRLLRKDAGEKGAMAITELRTPGPWLEAKARRLEQVERIGEGQPPGRPGDWVIDLALVAAPPPHVTTAQIAFKTGLVREPEYRFDVVIEYRPPVTFSVETAELPAGGGEGSTVFGSVRRPKDLPSLAVQTEPAALRAALEPTGERGFSLRLTWPGAPAGSAGLVTLTVGDERVSLPVAVSR